MGLEPERMLRQDHLRKSIFLVGWTDFADRCIASDLDPKRKTLRLQTSFKKRK